MNYRRDKYRKNIRNNKIYVSIIALLIVLGLSLVISNGLAKIIYKESISITQGEDSIVQSNTELVVSPEEKDSDKEDIEKYAKSLSSNSLILFQGGVFKNLDNAEEFKEKIENNTLASIVNDDKFERVILGISDKENFLDMTNMFKENNIQFVRQIYKIPSDVAYSDEIFEVINLFTKFILNNSKNMSNNMFDISNLKKSVEEIDGDYGEEGEYKTFNDLKDLILELDDDCSKNDLESILDFIYFSLNKYKN